MLQLCSAVPHHLLILFLLLMLSACGRMPKYLPLPPGSVVLAFGDSVTYGTGASRGEDWPTLLSDMTGWRIINEGIPGDTAEAGKNRLKDLLEEHHPTLVIVEIGGNDFLKGRSQKSVKEDIRDIVATIRRTGASVVLVAVPELSLLSALSRPMDAGLYAELGREERISVISNVFSDILAQSDLRFDAIHPNTKGYRHMATGFFSALKKIGLLRP